MQSEIVELRYSLNGITQTQLDLLFSNISTQDDQIIIKRITDPHASLSIDDIVLEGIFSQELIQNLSRAYAPPLSFKIQLSDDIRGSLRLHSAFEWQEAPTLYCGVSLLSFLDMQRMVGFTDAWHFLRSITSTEVASILKPLLVVKPKGLVAYDRSILHFVLPLHRIDFLQLWVNNLGQGTADLNWVSGSTGELSEEILQSVGSINPEDQPKIDGLLDRTSNSDTINFEQMFNRVLSVISL